MATTFSLVPPVTTFWSVDLVSTSSMAAMATTSRSSDVTLAAGAHRGALRPDLKREKESTLACSPLALPGVFSFHQVRHPVHSAAEVQLKPVPLRPALELEAWAQWVDPLR